MGPGGKPTSATNVTPVEVTVPEELTDPHALLKSSLPFLRQAKDERDGLLERETCVAIAVQTRALMSRAILVMDTLLKSLEARGASIEVTAPEKHKRSETLVHIGETTVSFGLEEPIDHVATKSKRPRAIFNEYRPGEDYKALPSGRLVLRVYSCHSSLPRRVWSDGKRQHVEDCLGKFISTVLLLVESERLERIARERREAEWEQEQRKRKERERLRAKEAARVKDLNQRLEDWTKAKNIRDLASAIERDGGDSEWLSWARGLADDLERRAVTSRQGDDDKHDDDNDY